MPPRNSSSSKRPAAWSVYVLFCSDKSLYCGIARDAKKRLAEHLKGHGSRYVRSRRPAKIVYLEACRSRSAALKREAAIKSLPRPKKLVLIKGL